MSRQKDKIYVVGHKNPDTDSICSAIAYAALKTKLTGHAYEPRRAGQLNEETQYVLEKFAVKPPKLLSDLKEQIKDVELKEVEGLTSNSSIRTAWETMRELNIHTLPVVRDGSLEGVITIGDIAKTSQTGRICRRQSQHFSTMQARISLRRMARCRSSIMMRAITRICISQPMILQQMRYQKE